MIRVSSIILFLILTVTASAQIQVQAPQQVVIGEQFRLQYIVNTTDVKGFRSGNIPSDAFDVLMGPSKSTQQSISIINGQMKQSSSVTYTYIVSALKNGTYIIPPARAKVDGKEIESKTIKITVSGKPNNLQQHKSGQQQRGNQQLGGYVRSAGSHISGSDLFIRVSANKQKVYEQEPILLTYKVYSQVELTQLEGKMPDLNGFHTQEVPLPQQKSFHIENVNGKPYRCVTWSQYVMYPQITGKLEIPSITFRGIVLQENPNVDPFEAFFNGGSAYIEVKKEIKAPSLSIQVDALPAKPSDFSGGVGQYSISANVDKNNVRAGEPVHVHIIISGTGNLKLLKQPELVEPKDFDKYDAKVSDKTNLTASGLTGNMIYDILIVPRNQGKYEIPAVKLVYFDITTSSYKTVSTQSLKLNVSPGNGHSNEIADYSQQRDSDIHPIHEMSCNIKKPGEYFYGNNIYILINTLLFVVFLILIAVFRNRAFERANIEGMKGKKANKVASKRLKKAEMFKQQGYDNEFYDEVLRALWGYVADKFAMQISALTRDNIAEQLQLRNINEDVISSLIEAIDECEFARYSPGDKLGNMQKTYNSAVMAITNIENTMKQMKANKIFRKEKHLRAVFLIILCFHTIMCQTLFAQSNPIDYKTKADVEYSKKNYHEAINIYNKILEHNVSSDVYYNLGNAYYRTDNITQAVLSYERGILLAPGDKDLKHNLNIARLKTIDKIMPTERIIFLEWYDSLRNSMTIDEWAFVSIASLGISLLLFLVYLFIDSFVIQRFSFYFSLLFVLIFVSGNIFAFQLKSLVEHTNAGIIISPLVTIKKTPNKQSSDVCIIHEGTRVDFLDTSINGWALIKLLDGREGWAPTNTFERL